MVAIPFNLVCKEDPSSELQCKCITLIYILFLKYQGAILSKQVFRRQYDTK